MNDVGMSELRLVLATMLVLALFAFVAVALFIRVWRKERRNKK